MNGFTDPSNPAARIASEASCAYDVGALSDAELITALDHRSEDALAEIYGRYGANVYGVVRSLCDTKLADEVTREVFLELWEAPSAFDPRLGSLVSHLQAAAHRQAVRMLRRVGADRIEEEVEPSSPLDASSRALGENRSPHALLADLSIAQRQAVVLAYFAGYTYQEIAEQLSKPKEVVKSDIQQALVRLRDKS